MNLNKHINWEITLATRQSVIKTLTAYGVDVDQAEKLALLKIKADLLQQQIWLFSRDPENAPVLTEAKCYVELGKCRKFIRRLNRVAKEKNLSSYALLQLQTPHTKLDYFDQDIRSQILLGKSPAEIERELIQKLKHRLKKWHGVEKRTV